MKEESVVFRPTKVTLVAILLSSMLILMGGAAVAPALNDIKLAFPGQDFLTSLIITLPSLAVALVGYAVGIAADRYGKVKVLLLALAGGAPGGLLAMLLARHKIRKPAFAAGLPMMLVVQAGAVAYLIQFGLA